MGDSQSGVGRSALANTLAARLDQRRQRQHDLLKTLCDIECGSEMLDGVGQVVDLVEAELSRLGLAVTRHPAEGRGDHLVAWTPANGPRIVLGGHLDTTYTDYGPLPDFGRHGQYLCGPGTADMKGGIVVFLAAMDALKHAGLLDQLPLTVIFNTDEERGAVSSRHLFLGAAEGCAAALFSECGGPNGELVVARRAKLSYRLAMHGMGKHAGAKEADKVSALVEMSHKIIAIERLNGRFEGASFNVGRAEGGIASNTVPGEAEALVDIRYPQTEQEQPIRAAIEAICARTDVAGASTELQETSFRPAWNSSAEGLALFERVSALAGSLGYEVKPESRGGTADSNWFGALGLPTLDGFGPVGFDDHTPKEKIIEETLYQRPLLAALLVADIAERPMVK